MIRQRPQLSVSVFAAMILVAATTNADDRAKPDPVLMTENALTTEQAQDAQKAWAKHLGFNVGFESSIGMQLRLIPPGEFRMGWEERTGVEGPQIVTHTQPYFIGRYEVTQGEWKRVMGHVEWSRNYGVGDRFPAHGINFAEAAEFCRKLTQLDREAGKLPEGYGYRLPTDAELEFACRAGTVTLTYFGDKLSSLQANFDGNYPFMRAEKGPFLSRLAEVGSYPANAWGLYDNLGSVYEWCLDWHHEILKGGVDPVQLLPSPERPIPQRVIRGGSWPHAGRYCRSANRYYEVPEMRGKHVGLRPVLSKLHLEGLHHLTDLANTKHDQVWTRDGTNTRIWNKRNSKAVGYHVKAGHVHRRQGENFALTLTDQSHHTWAHTCLTDGRILVRSDLPNQEPGYYLLTPNKNAAPTFESIQCDLASKGILNRISLSPSETRVCFEFQTGFDDAAKGRTIYVADFDAERPAITGATPIANEDGKPIWYAYPRWSEDESSIVYQAEEKLYLYSLANNSATLVATNDPTMKRAPK